MINASYDRKTAAEFNAKMTAAKVAAAEKWCEDVAADFIAYAAVNGKFWATIPAAQIPPLVGGVSYARLVN